MKEVTIAVLNLLTGTAEILFWVGIGIIILSVIGFALIMIGSFVLSAMLAAL